MAISVERQVFISQHIGDLETVAALTAFRRAANDLSELYETRPTRIVADTHPDYVSSRFARESGLPVVHVQHHYAHVLACMAENELESPVFGVAWDGTGHGPDGTVWGGEFLKITGTGFERFAHFRTFQLPGGEAAIKEPRRCALGLVHEIFGDAIFAMPDLPPIRAFSPIELRVLRTMLERQVNTPRTSSAGRLEFRAEVVDWEPMIREIVEEVLSGTDRRRIAAKLHNTFVEVIVAEAHRALEEHVVLAGGCFQNKYLTERAVLRLTTEGFRPHWHQRVPPNDGGIALGQALAAGRHPLSEGDSPCV